MSAGEHPRRIRPASSAGTSFEWGGRAKPVLGRLFGLAFAIGGQHDLNKLASLLESAVEPY